MRSRIATTAVALVALHVVDDAFLQPEPGTSAGDHVVGGVLLLAVLTLAGIACHRGRAGLRGAVALAGGVLALGTGGEALFAASQGGVGRDDFTGLVAAVAGLVLLGTGAEALWRSRRRDGSRPRRYARRVAVFVGGVLALYWVVLPTAAAYVSTHVAIGSADSVDLGAPHEEVVLTTDDGLRLPGWYVPSRNGAAVIAVPGASGPQRSARMLVEHGYGVLLFEHRGSSGSPGDPNLLGWNRSRDVHAAVAFLETRPDVHTGRIGAIGFSVGGETLLQAAAESSALDAVVSEGAGIRTLREHWALDGPVRWADLPVWAVITATTAAFSGQAPPAALQDLVPRIAPRPVFLISAAHGTGGEELNSVFHAAAGELATWWEIPEASHTGGLRARPEEYERRVVAFFDDALLAGAAP